MCHGVTSSQSAAALNNEQDWELKKLFFVQHAASISRINQI